ncbi:MAG TPA: discoidin domain-containing protein [Planctomycetaceae bacterium]|nr:discoidin domain-containing protein [Planctomycetaceae bacterium]
MPRDRLRTFVLCSAVLCGFHTTMTTAQVLDKQRLLDAQTFWDNRDWDWYKANIPFFECPDADVTTTYYYRWELVTKHLTYGSPDTGYTFTEFIDRPFWSGTYGAISCPAGHQLYEVRWLKEPRFARDYARYWFRTPGAEPRRYSTWLADAVWAVHQVHPDDAFILDLLPDLQRNYEAWEQSHFVPQAGLFWQTGHDDGMEININSRQTQDTVRGAPGYRPTLNSYLFADALAIARVARLAGDAATADAYAAKAAALKANVLEKLWDPKRQFFFHMFQRDEERHGHTVKAGTLTHQTGRFAGSPHGRELIGYVPWQFNLPGPGYESAWKFLMERDHFFADYGPTVTERHDPLFHISDRCCWWSGQSWPYATTQTLVALANLLNSDEQDVIGKADYFKLLQVYARTHQKHGRPYIAEAAHPDSGSWDGHDSYNHSEHYFHSAYCDLIISGLAGLRPRDDETIVVNPLAPDGWDWFALDDVPYRGRSLAIVWDRTGARYGRGAGLHVIADGTTIASSPRLGRLMVELPERADPAVRKRSGGDPDRTDNERVNFAVNNEGFYYPRATASFTAERTWVEKSIDGNSWYHVSPPNRWTTAGSPHETDWLEVDFGIERPIDTVRLYFLDDGEGAPIAPPARYELESWAGGEWVSIPGQRRLPEEPGGRRANITSFPTLRATKLRAVFTHRGAARTGLSEFEAWGDAGRPVEAAPPPPGNLAANAAGEGYPKASASWTSRYDRVEMANDGRIHFQPSPHNRWTSYESPNETDWLEIDFGEPQTVGRVDLYLYDDRGGVQAPRAYTIQFFDGSGWRDAARQQKQPAAPAGGRVNTVTFDPVEARKLRVVFTHDGRAGSGLTEIEIRRE